MKSIGFLEKHPYLVRSLWRRVHTPVNSLIFDTINVNEFPKSGGTWTCRLLRDCLDWRFDDNAYPNFGKSIIKHHRIGYTPKNCLYVIRDPRDVAVSYYHHCKAEFDTDPFNKHNVKLNDKYIFEGASDESERLEKFVEVIATRPLSPAFTWGDFYRSIGPNNKVVRYEDLRENAEDTLADVFRHFGQNVSDEAIARVVDAHDIKKILSKRSSSEKNSFIRKGAVGGWKESLSEKSIDLIEKDAGSLLSTYNYA